MSETADGFELLARLRGLERQLRRLRADWRSFRDHPCAEALADLRLRAGRFSEAVEALALGVSQRALPGDSLASRMVEPGPPRERPAPRDVIAASRDLDARVWEAVHRWKQVLEGDREGDLDRLVAVLNAAVARAATLMAALGGDPSSIRPDRDPGRNDPGTPQQLVERGAGELEGMLWRLQADWQRLRHSPNLDRLRLLAEGFAAASGVATRLRVQQARTGAARFQHLLRVGREITVGVGFRPYRDPFTATYNREGFDAVAGAELKRCRRYGRGFGLLLLEVSAPDLPGLRRALSTVRAELRDYDLIARYEGDQIIIGVPEGGSGATRRIASRVLRALRAGEMGRWFRKLSIATHPEDGSTLSGLIDSARGRLQP